MKIAKIGLSALIFREMGYTNVAIEHMHAKIT